MFFIFIRAETLGDSAGSHLLDEVFEVDEDGSVSAESEAERIEAMVQEGADAEAETEETVEEEDESASKVVAMSSQHMRALHKKMDSDADGKVSMTEITSFAENMRRALAKRELDSIIASKDTDKNGKLNLQEFVGDHTDDKEFSEEDRQSKTDDFKSLDTNKDNQIDADELPALFHHYTNEKVEVMLTGIAMKGKDLDGNGVLTLEEFYDHMRPGEPDETFHISQEDRDVFKKLDTDSSKTLNAEELKAWESGSFHTAEAMTQLIEGADADGDKQVTADEMDNAREKIAQGFGEAQAHLEEWREMHFGPLNANEL
jgi:Ca2+-binding EF-hand superfamily protein